MPYPYACKHPHMRQLASILICLPAYVLVEMYSLPAGRNEESLTCELWNQMPVSTPATARRWRRPCTRRSCRKGSCSTAWLRSGRSPPPAAPRRRAASSCAASPPDGIAKSQPDRRVSALQQSLASGREHLPGASGGCKLKFTTKEDALKHSGAMGCMHVKHLAFVGDLAHQTAHWHRRLKHEPARRGVSPQCGGCCPAGSTRYGTVCESVPSASRTAQRRCASCRS